MVLLANMSCVGTHHVLEQYTSRVLDCPTREFVSGLTARMADYRFTEAEYEASLVWLLRQCAVRPEFAAELDTFFAHRESIASAMRVKHLEVSTGRPRLTDKLSAARRRALDARGGVSGDAMDSFAHWVSRVRFPNTISQRLKRRLYMVMAQPHLDHGAVVARLADDLVVPTVLREKIARPEKAVIAEVLENLNIQRSPFAELTAFMRSCFRAFPQRDLQAMTLLKYMQLYLAAYQHRDLWRDCWTAIHPLLSYQVIKDVEEFVARTPFNQEAFVEILLTD